MGQPLSIPGQARGSGRSSYRRAPSRAAMNGLPFSLGRNAVVRSAGLLSVSAVAKALASIAFVVLALRALGPSEGGQVILVFSIVRLAQAAVEGGLSRYLTREVARNPGATGAYAFSSIKLIFLPPAPARRPRAPR